VPEAATLAARLLDAESAISAERRAMLSTFQGAIRMGGSDHAPHHGAE